MPVNCYPGGAKPQFMLATGLPAVGYQLFAYVAGSVGTKQNTYTDSGGLSANTNPIVLNTLGEPSNQIWLSAGQPYKFVLAPATDADPPTSPVWTIDNLRGINDTTVTQDQWVASGLAPTFVSATQFTLPGDQTSVFQVGRRTKASVTAGTSYGTITGSTFGASTTVTVDTTGSNPIDAGLSAVSYGLLSKTNDAMPRGVFLTVPNIRSYLSGLGMSTAGGSATMSIAAGVAADSTNVSMLTLAAAISKTTASWAVGTGNGGIDTGAIANSTTYHFYLITRLDTSVVDVIFSLSASAPTLPANYTLFRRIGSMRTTGAAQWTSFIQDGDTFSLVTQVADSFSTNPGIAAVTRTLTSIPTGARVEAILQISHTNSSNGGNVLTYTSDLSTTDSTPSAGNSDTSTSELIAGGAVVAATIKRVFTNTSSQVRSRQSFSDASCTFQLMTLGWVDTRGRNL